MPILLLRQVVAFVNIPLPMLIPSFLCVGVIVGQILGPVVGSQIQKSLTSTIEAFRVTCMLLGMLCIIFSFLLWPLKSIGTALGETSIDTSGSLYGKSYLSSSKRRIKISQLDDDTYGANQESF